MLFSELALSDGPSPKAAQAGCMVKLPVQTAQSGCTFPIDLTALGCSDVRKP
jgi:hypothetical protein